MKRHHWLALPLLIGAAPALAHSGHDVHSSAFAGLLHPLSGFDHLLAMLMVGLWAGIAFPRHWWVCPAAFVAFMLAGFAFGVTGGALPLAQMLITASLVGLGLALLLDIRPPVALSAALVALFAIGHGFAHGSEMAVGTDQMGFASGFLMSTALLHALGLVLSLRLRGLTQRRVGRATGLVATVAGTVLMWSA